MLLGIDTLLAVLNSYVPHDLSPVRYLIAAVQLVFMAITMGVTMRRVLEDY
jgi:hypothetical protein